MRVLPAVGALALVVAADACARDGAARVGVGPSLVFPRGLLQSVASVVVREYAAGPASCDPAAGAVSGAGTPDATTTLSQQGCTGGAVWCGSMQVATSDAPRIFAAEADDATGGAVASGCVQVVVDQEALPVTIAMRRVVAAAVCGDGVLQPTEQCNPPGTASDIVCDASCHTKEELLSAVDSTPGVHAPGAASPGDRTAPALLWPAGAAPAGRFVALWQDATNPPDSHVALRVLGDRLDPLPANAAPALAAGSLWMTGTTDPSQFPSLPDPGNQQLPAAAYAADARRTFIAFADDSGGTFDVHLRTLDANFTAEQATPVAIDGSGGEPGVQTHPAIALGAGDLAYVVWQSAPDVGPGQIVGRTVDVAHQALGAQVVLSTGSTSQTPSVAALSTGWVVAWQSGSDVVVRRVGPDGQPAAAAVVVSTGHTGTQDHPSVASLGGGDDRFAVAWADHGQNGADVVVQRFDATGAPLPGDSAAPVNDAVTDGDQLAPSVAGSANGAFFAVTWLDAASGHVRARLLDGSAGFDFNNVSGQNGEFQVSLADGRTRAAPVVAVGGAGPFVAFAWEDQSAGAPGIYGRRFPLPP